MTPKKERNKKLIDEQRDRLFLLGQKAMDIYDRALTQGEDISVATEKIATNILRTLGLIGDKAEPEIAIMEDVNFIEIGVGPDDNITEIESGQKGDEASKVPAA